MTSVLITRPLSVSQPLAQALQKLGYATFIESLLTIVPWPVPRPKKRVAAMMITSGAVFNVLEGRRREIADLFTTPCFCVGPRTAEKAKDFGFCNISYSSSDGAELAKLVLQTPDERNSFILHIAARDVDSKAEEILREAGRKIVPWPIYEAVPLTHLSYETIELLKNKKLDAVVIFSSRSAKTLNELLIKHKLEACCDALTAICLSDAVAANLTSKIWRSVRAAPQPNEEAVTTCLQAACPVNS